MNETNINNLSIPSDDPLPDCEEEIGPDQLVLLRLPLALFPGLLVRPAGQEVLEDVAASQNGVAGHVVHPPDQALPPLGDEVLLEAAGGLLLGQVRHGDDREPLHEARVQPVEVFVPAGGTEGETV